jgi:hypothetical protein
MDQGSVIPLLDEAALFLRKLLVVHQPYEVTHRILVSREAAGTFIHHGRPVAAVCTTTSV